MDISNKAAMLRKELGEDNSSPIDIFSLAHTIGNLTLIFYPLEKRLVEFVIKVRTLLLLLLTPICH
jgi:hypothetical protein